MTTILLLHGMPGRGDQWREVGAALAPHRIIGPTLEGFDRDWAGAGFPSTERHAQQIAELIADEDPQDLICVAWSFSCHPLLLALCNGLACRQVILFEPSGESYLRPSEREAFERDASAAFGAIAAEIDTADDRRLAQLAFAATGSVEAWDALNEATRAPFIDNADAMRRVVKSGAVPAELREEHLNVVQTPVLVVSGERSRTMFKLASTRLAAILPMARHVSVREADHLWPITRPSWFAAFISKEIGRMR